MTTSSSLPVGDGAVVAGITLDAGGIGGIGGMTNVGHGGVGVGGTGLLALTGAGPGTLLLALTGMASLIAGGVAVLTGRHLLTTNDSSSPLRDLAYRAAEVR